MCPLLGLVGPWTQLQEVIETWLKNRTRAKGEVESAEVSEEEEEEGDASRAGEMEGYRGRLG